jgi:hypothetical protein
MNLRVAYNAGKFLISCTIGSFSRSAQLHEWVNEWIYSSASFLSDTLYPCRRQRFINVIGLHLINDIFYVTISLLYWKQTIQFHVQWQHANVSTWVDIRVQYINNHIHTNHKGYFSRWTEWPRNHSSFLGSGSTFPSSSQLPDWLWCPPDLVSNRYRGSISLWVNRLELEAVHLPSFIAKAKGGRTPTASRQASRYETKDAVLLHSWFRLESAHRSSTCLRLITSSLVDDMTSSSEEDILM